MLLHECLPNFRIPRGRAGQLLLGHSAVKTFLWSEFLQLLHPGYCDTKLLFLLYPQTQIPQLLCLCNSTLGHSAPNFCPPALTARSPSS